MNSTISCGIKGKYKVDIYSGKTFVETTDWFSNDITDTGILYPFDYPFARCFMFLSLGSGAIGAAKALETGFGAGSSVPIQSFLTDNGIQTGQYIGYGAYSIDQTSPACGTNFQNYGVDMHRAWVIPSGDGNPGLKETLNIGCLMVSPSSGGDPLGNKAFSLVDQQVTIPVGFNATIYYQLSLNFSDYINKYILFSGKTAGNNGFFDTGNASNPLGAETFLLSSWNNLSGIYRQIFPGMQFVDNYGACVSTEKGHQLEPCLVNCDNLHFYLSPDISQFAVSKLATGIQGTTITENSAYNSYGLGANYFEYVAASPSDAKISSIKDSVYIHLNTPKDLYYYAPDLDKNNSSVGLSATSSAKGHGDGTNLGPKLTDSFSNIHLDEILNCSGYNTQLNNFKYSTSLFVNSLSKSTIFASQGLSGFSAFYPNYGQTAVFSTALRRMPANKIPHSRVQKATKVSRISPLQAMGFNTRFGTMTLGYIQGSFTSLDGTDFKIHPYMEYLFFDSSGRAANCPHYRIVPDLYLANRGSGVYNAVFSITGLGIDGSSNSPIQRIWNITGFMGQYDSTSPSGIQTTGTKWTEQYGSGTSGVYFSGVNPIPGVSGVSGDYKMGTNGWGEVYGFIAPNSGAWWNLPFDTCLLDNPVWSGFSGQDGFGTTPNPTGEASLLCWPYQQAKVGIAITGMRYKTDWAKDQYANTFLIFDDPNDTVVGPSGFQLVYDVTWSGYTLIGNAKASGVNYELAFTGVNGVGNGVMILLNHLGDATVTGYNFSTSVGAYSRGSGQSITAAMMTGYSFKSGCQLTGTNALFGVGHLLEPTGLRLVPTNLKKPDAKIHHVEFLSGSGYRLLPNYGYANNNFITGNTYTPTLGGYFPGLSTENGMELYFDFIWSGAVGG